MSASAPSQEVVPRLLLVDDDDIDILNIRRQLRSLKLDAPVSVAHDGIEALEVLRGADGDAPLSRPYIIILDLNMPRMGGFEFLTELRGDAALKDSVVFVLTTSDAPDDIRRAHSFNIAGYIPKSQGPDSLSAFMAMLDSYQRVAQLPH